VQFRQIERSTFSFFLSHFIRLCSFFPLFSAKALKLQKALLPKTAFPHKGLRCITHRHRHRPRGLENPPTTKKQKIQLATAIRVLSHQTLAKNLFCRNLIEAEPLNR
jgi:hypothetical protein